MEFQEMGFAPGVDHHARVDAMRVVRDAQDAKVMPAAQRRHQAIALYSVFGANTAQIVLFVMHMAAGRC